MARETRGSATKADTASTPSKRKRKSSPTPPPTTSLKVVLPSPSSLNPATSANGGDIIDHETKRQRISLKVNTNGEGKARSRSRSPVPDQEEEVIVVVNVDEEDEAEDGGHRLSSDIRAALAQVISQMAVDLPPPLNGILSLWLPPDFTKKEENTLAYVLRQESLTWESLVDLLHVFAENLLVPCSYPNPMPSLSQIHQPVPPLPSHYRPHVIYTFCAALHSLMLEIQPEDGLNPHARPPERWALMQKLPSSQVPGSTTEWFTAAADVRAVTAGLEKIEKEGGNLESTLLETLAAGGDKFGLATPVAVQSAIGSSSKPHALRLTDVMIRKASLKMGRWKEIQAKRKGYFGSVARGVQSASSGETWTSSLAPTYDSTTATGGGSYYTTLQAMHEGGRYRRWGRRVLSRTNQPGLDPQAGWYGTIDGTKDETREDSIEAQLEENVEYIDELQDWQEIRVRKGDAKMISEREQLVANTLLDSLSQLAARLKPSDIVTADIADGFAHKLSKRFLPVSSPVIRGTLDPRRPRAVHDSTTMRPRPVTPQKPNASPIPTTAYPAASPTTATYRYQPSQPQSPAYPVASPAYRPPPNPPYNPYTPSPTGNTIYNRGPVPNPSPASHIRPGPGPSALRQSFGPGRPPINPASGLMSQAVPNYRSGGVPRM